MVVESKNRKFKNFFSLCTVRGYIKKAVYVFVDFRIKSAGSSNYGGQLFFPSGKKTNIAIIDSGY